MTKPQCMDGQINWSCIDFVLAPQVLGTHVWVNGWEWWNGDVAGLMILRFFKLYVRSVI